MTLHNIIDARPGTPIPTYGLEKLITQPDPREEKLHTLETKLAEIQTQLRELQKIATAMDKVYELEARIKTLQAFVAELYNAIKQPTNLPKPEPPPPPQEKPKEAENPKPDQPPAENKADPPPLTETERVVLRALFSRLKYWYGRTNLKVDDKGYFVIGRDDNFGVNFSQFVAITAKFGLADYVITRGNDRAGYYVEIKVSDMANALARLRELDQIYRKAISGI
jgi:hypothetical protein